MYACACTGTACSLFRSRGRYYTEVPVNDRQSLPTSSGAHQFGILFILRISSRVSSASLALNMQNDLACRTRRRVPAWNALRCHTGPMLCHVGPCRAILCRAVPYRAALCHTMRCTTPCCADPVLGRTAGAVRRHTMCCGVHCVPCRCFSLP